MKSLIFFALLNCQYIGFCDADASKRNRWTIPADPKPLLSCGFAFILWDRTQTIRYSISRGKLKSHAQFCLIYLSPRNLTLSSVVPRNLLNVYGIMTRKRRGNTHEDELFENYTLYSFWFDSTHLRDSNRHIEIRFIMLVNMPCENKVCWLATSFASLS